MYFELYYHTDKHIITNMIHTFAKWLLIDLFMLKLLSYDCFFFAFLLPSLLIDVVFLYLLSDFK